jgi:uncharacterized membrane protein
MISKPASVGMTTARDGRQRIDTIDMLRGLVMLIMLLDHVRERVLLHLQVSDPMDLSTTTIGLFFSRLAAHLCAPVFVFLTGLSAWLYQHHHSGVARPVRSFLVKRGLFLIALELTVVNFAWMGSYHTLWLQVIWVIGLSMLALALCSSLPRPLLAVIGFSLVFGHNLLTPISFAPQEWGYSLWTILHDRNYLLDAQAAASLGLPMIKLSYPLLPWIGVIVLGYLAGPLYLHSYSTTARKRWLLGLGLGCFGLLLLLRGLNLYGETLPWQQHASGLLSLMDWLNFTKYPPSLNFLLLTLGLMCLLLRAFEHPLPTSVRSVLANFGAAPMFFYLLHLYALLLLYQLLLAWFGPNQGQMYGVDGVAEVWLITVFLALVLYWPTRWFARLKQRSTATWIRYL